MKHLFIILTALIGLSVILGSCKKEEESIIVSGTMVDPRQGTDLEGVKVELWAQKIESGIYSAHYDSYGTVTTAGDGKFRFEIENQTYASVKLSFSKTNYYNWEYEIDGDVIKNSMLHDETYQMQAKAWIEFYINNQNPVDSQDSFEFRILNGFTECENCCTGETLRYTGAFVEETFICQMIGHEDVVIRWVSRKGDSQTGKDELVFIPSFDTTRIEFLY